MTAPDAPDAPDGPDGSGAIDAETRAWVAEENAHDVPGAFNLRDLGGTPVEEGVIAPRRIFRCDLLHRVDPARAAAWLRHHDVRTLIDLRTEGERADDGFMEASEHLDAKHRGLLDEVWSWEAENQAADDWFLRDRTIEMYVHHGDRVATVLTDIADAPAGVLFHCTAGKDRTGVVASALLGVLGAPREAIVEDYARSTAAMEGIIGWYRDLAANDPNVPPIEHDPVRERRIIERAASPATMAGVVDAVVERYGSFAGWARDAGLGADAVARLRSKLVVEA